MTLVASFSTKLLILRKTSGKKYNIYGTGPFRFDFLWLVCVNASFDFKKLKATIPPLRENHSQWKESRH